MLPLCYIVVFIFNLYTMRIDGLVIREVYMESRIYEFQLQILEREIERYPDIVPIALKKMRIKTIIEVSREKFPRFMRVMNREKFQKYVIKECHGK